MLVFHASGLSRGFVSYRLGVGLGCWRQSIAALRKVLASSFRVEVGNWAFRDALFSCRLFFEG